MNAAALVLVVAYLVVCFALRTWWQHRRTGDSGFRGISGPAWSARWWAGVLFVVAVVAGLAGPLTALSGLAPVVATPAWLPMVGAFVAVAGAGGTAAAQWGMGSAWRIGVDDEEGTNLVTTGMFAAVRNPVFTAMVTTGAGITLMVPNLVSVCALALLVGAVELQVRVVEEPYLQCGVDGYDEYASRTGRFIPAVGRIRPTATGDDSLTLAGEGVS